MADSAQPMLRRVCRLSLEFATAMKRHEIGRLLEAYRSAVNFYVRSPLVVRTIGATAWERCFDVSPAITRAMPISSALETS